MSGFFAEGRFWDLSEPQVALLADAEKRLTAAGLPGALSEVQRIWAMAQADANAFENMITRRANREPFSHLVGFRDFYNHRFYVSPAVLDPRPDTETLVVEALKLPFQSVLDLGTGSGCILLSLLAERPDAVGVGADYSGDALIVAARNVQKLELEHRTQLILSDWYASVEGTFDLIVSNPPYIAVDEMVDLQPEVRDHEPRMALTDESDGLSCYRKIIAEASPYLNAGGHVMVEIGPTQAKAVSDMFRAKGFANIQVIQDLDQRDRVVFGQKTGS